MSEQITSNIRRPMGLKNVHIAPLTKDDKDTVTYGSPIFVKGIESFQFSMKYAEGNAFSDDIKDTSIKLPVSCDLTLTFGEYLPEIAAMIQGNDTTLGGKVVKTTDLQKEYALFYEVANSDGSTTYNIFYKVKLACDGETNNTKGENVEFAKFQLTGQALPLRNGVLYRQFNSSEKLKPDTITNFYKNVILPNADIKQGD